ncbi:MAG: YhfC family intramembrane metalloprotease [Oscillospiraceae bacterium]|nr:YhfC family intramembrane metalloprotease [Oscillospiraceae bacterium]
MVPVSTVFFCILTLFVSLLLPLLVLMVFAVRCRKQGIVSAWLLGAAGFFVTQMLIRLPVLTFLQGQNWFLEFAQNHMFGYAFSLAFTAGLFELAGRFVVARLLRKNLTFHRALAAGLGHGGIEAILLIGMTYVNNLIYIVMINSGNFDAMVAQTAAMGVDVAQLELIRTQFLTASPLLFALAGLERLLAMIGHAAMSMVVCYGVVHRKVLPSLLLCLGIHTLMDLTAGLSLALPQSIAYPIIYAILIVMAVFSLFVIREIFRRWKKEVSHDSEK